MPILGSVADSSTTSGGLIAGAGLPPFMSSTGLTASTNSTGISAAPSTTVNTTATTTSQSSSAATAAATMAAAMFPEDMDDHDMGRLQAMLEARGFPPHLAGVLGQYSIFLVWSNKSYHVDLIIDFQIHFLQLTGPRMHHLIINRAMAPSATSKAQQLLQVNRN